MKILIAGAGKVGSTLARELTGDGHAVTLIDQNKEALSQCCELSGALLYKRMTTDRIAGHHNILGNVFLIFLNFRNYSFMCINNTLRMCNSGTHFNNYNLNWT